VFALNAFWAPSFFRWLEADGSQVHRGEVAHFHAVIASANAPIFLCPAAGFLGVRIFQTSLRMKKTSSADNFSAAIIKKCNEMPNIQLSRLTLCCSECLSLRPGFEHVRSEVTFGQTSAELHAHESTRRIA
jgi:hypothetical protein